MTIRGDVGGLRRAGSCAVLWKVLDRERAIWFSASGVL
jgi:hypothetical protein